MDKEASIAEILDSVGRALSNYRKSHSSITGGEDFKSYTDGVKVRVYSIDLGVIVSIDKLE